MRFRTILTLGTLFAGALTLNPGAACADVVRYPIPNSTFPIAQAVQVSGNAATYYVSGQVPPVVSKEAEPGSPQAYGDTKTQTIGVLGKIKGILEGLGLGMGDVVKMQVFLVHDARAPMDFKAFMEGYTQFFGGNQPIAGKVCCRRCSPRQSRIFSRNRSYRCQRYVGPCWKHTGPFMMPARA